MTNLMDKIFCTGTLFPLWHHRCLVAGVYRHMDGLSPSPLEFCRAQPPDPLVSARSGSTHSASFAHAQWGRPYSSSPPPKRPGLHPIFPNWYKINHCITVQFSSPLSFLSAVSLTCRSLLSCSATLSVFCRAARRLSVLLWEAAASWRLFLREDVFSLSKDSPSCALSRAWLSLSTSLWSRDALASPSATWNSYGSDLWVTQSANRKSIVFFSGQAAVCQLFPLCRTQFS